MPKSIWEERYREMRTRSSFEARKNYIDQFRFNEFPLADAYEAALFMYKRAQYRRGLLEETRPESPYYYRGLSDEAYSLTPTIFRGEGGDIQAELDRLSSLVRFLEAELGVSEPEAVAIAQHYHDEAGVGTWLLDVTSNPLVALFHATTNDKGADIIGVVTGFSESNITEFQTDAPVTLGDIRVIEPEIDRVGSVPRIDRQDAAFFEGAHPRLFDQYIGYDITFRQQPDIVFEDPELGITRDELLPESDPIIERIDDWVESRPEPDTLVRPPRDLRETPSPATYRALIDHWVATSDADPDALGDERVEMLDRLCEFHHQLYEEHREDLSRLVYSLRRLRDGYGAIAGNPDRPAPDLRSVLKEAYITQSNADFRDDGPLVAELIDAFLDDG